MKKVIIYVHGFNSGPGEKSIELQNTFADCEVIAPQLPYDPDQAVAILREIIGKHLGNDLHIIGTSLGAFYVMYASTLYKDYENVLYYLINPSFTPHNTLQRYKNSTVVNYKTNEQFKVTGKLLLALKKYYQQITEMYDESCIHSSNYFLSTQDEVLVFDKFKEYISKFKVPFRIYYSEQGHRFTDISLVVRKLKSNMIY